MMEALIPSWNQSREQQALEAVTETWFGSSKSIYNSTSRQKNASNMRSWGTPNKSHQDCKAGSFCILLGWYHLNGNKERNKVLVPVILTHLVHSDSTLPFPNSTAEDVTLVPAPFHISLLSFVSLWRQMFTNSFWKYKILILTHSIIRESC